MPRVPALGYSRGRRNGHPLLATDDPRADPRDPDAEVRRDLFGWALGLVRRRWRLVLAGLGAVLLAAVAYLHLATYRYTAELRVTAVYSAQQLPSGLSGIASLAGISLPGDKAVTPIALYSEAMRSRDVAAAVVADPVLMRHIFAEEWDAAAGRWRDPGGLVRGLLDGAKRLLGVPVQPWSPPDAADVQRYLAKHLAIIEAPKTNVTTIAVNDPDPEMARRLLALLNEAADRHLRERALARSSEYIAYLERKLLEVQVADYRESLVQALSAQERTRMMASSDAPYAAEPLGAITASVRPTTPKPAVVLAAALVFGLLLGFAMAAIVDVPGRRRPNG